jgi:hypothetical protein
LNNAAILGCDIDPTAIDRSKQNVEAFKMPPALNNRRLTFRCKNFLSMTKDDVLSEATSLWTIVFGGPPYTPKDLSEKFIHHSIHELGADIVVFLLPERCGKDAAGIQEALNSQPNKISNTRQQWKFVNKELANSTFDFEGDNVTQPSILQCWYKTER